MNQKDRKENGALPPETGQTQTEPAGAVQTETELPGTVVHVTVNDDATTTVFEGHTGICTNLRWMTFEAVASYFVFRLVDLG